MIEEKKVFEKEIIQLFQSELEGNKRRFEINNINFKPIELKIVKKDNDNYTSEIRSYFTRNNDVIGVIEFFVFYDGHPEATKAEFHNWFVEEIDNILKASSEY